MIKIKINGKEVEVNDKTSYYELTKEFNTSDRRPYLVRVGHDIKELRRFAKAGESIEFLYYNDDFVKKAYARTAILMMLKALNDVFPGDESYLKFRIQNALYFEVTGKTIDEKSVELVIKKFDKMVDDKIIIKKVSYAKSEAFKILDENKMEDVKLLFKYSYKPTIKLRYIDDYVRYINGELLYHTGYIRHYKISKYKSGLIISLSTTDKELDIKEDIHGDKEFNTLNDSTNWAKKLEINTVGKLNEHIANDEFNHIAIMTESYQDKQIGDIAEAAKKSNKRFVFIAGPSSSGKTSFAHRLAYHLIALDLTPHIISCDNFFKERVDCPKDENGEYDFEIIESMDVDLLSNTMKKLQSGMEVELPTFNFATGKKEYSGDKLKLKDDDVVIMEGIHCLNPALVPDISQDDIFKIYISALTEVCIDNANRIATSDLRLIRRMIRDIHSRSISVKETILRWKSVRRGEEISIFPYQERADVYFNSALIYEFSTIKDQALAKLYQIADDEDVGIVARRIIKILNFFLSIGTEAIPAYSIAREFLGDSIMEVG